MKYVYGIAGFALGVMAGLLLAVVETRVLIYLQCPAVAPLIIGVTVLLCIAVGVITGIRLAIKRMRS